jgi:hypothetical protein
METMVGFVLEKWRLLWRSTGVLVPNNDHFHAMLLISRHAINLPPEIIHESAVGFVP